MIVQTKVRLNPRLDDTIIDRQDKIIFGVASETLRQSESVIPMRTGNMRRSSMTAGVKGSNLNYYIGSYTSYASIVWNFPDTTNWTTPGTNNKWFARVWKEKGVLITTNVIERNKL